MPFEIKWGAIMEIVAIDDYGYVYGMSLSGNQVNMILKDGSTQIFDIDDLRFPALDLWAVTEIGVGGIFYDAIHLNSVSAVDDALARKGNGRYEIRHFVSGEWVDITYLVLEGKVFQVVPFEWIPIA